MAFAVYRPIRREWALSIFKQIKYDGRAIVSFCPGDATKVCCERMTDSKLGHNRIGLSGLNKLNVETLEYLNSGDLIRLTLCHDGQSGTVPVLATVDHGCQQDMVLTKADFDEALRVWNFAELGGGFLMLRISKNPDPVRQEESDRRAAAQYPVDLQRQKEARKEETRKARIEAQKERDATK